MSRVAPGAPGLRARVVVAREHFTVDVALEVAAGETVAVMGPSGAGKSTLLHALAGLQPLDDGEVAVAGRVIDRVAAPRVRTSPMERGVVLLGQDARLFPHLSARENVAFGPRSAGVDRASARRDADDRLARVGLPGAGGRMPRELSGGEGQRVAVARALAAAPRVVLLDEPLVALDPETAGDIRRMLADQLTGVTTVTVTHDADDALALADRLLIVEAGRPVQLGAVRDVLASPASRFVAAIAGTNRLVGASSGGAWASGRLRLTTADAESRRLVRHDGSALAAVFRPEHVRLAGPDAGVNTWDAVIRRIEPTLGGVRVETEDATALLPGSAAAGLAPGDTLRVGVDPSDVRFLAVD